MSFNYSRYQNRYVFRNARAEYIKQFSNREIKYIDQYASPKFKYPSEDLLGRLKVDEEYWSPGMRFYKLAAKYYGDPTLWWIIPWFNQVPLESDFGPGDMVMIPRPLEMILGFFK